MEGTCAGGSDILPMQQLENGRTEIDESSSQVKEDHVGLDSASISTSASRDAGPGAETTLTDRVLRES